MARLSLVASGRPAPPEKDAAHLSAGSTHCKFQKVWDSHQNLASLWDENSLVFQYPLSVITRPTCTTSLAIVPLITFSVTLHSGLSDIG